jgi:hypothetical protein
MQAIQQPPPSGTTDQQQYEACMNARGWKLRQISDPAKLSKDEAQRIASNTAPVHINLMEYRGVRYTIRIGIARGQWQVAIYFPNNELPEERPVVGTRRDAEIAAQFNY